MDHANTVLEKGFGTPLKKNFLRYAYDIFAEKSFFLSGCSRLTQTILCLILFSLLLTQKNIAKLKKMLFLAWMSVKELYVASALLVNALRKRALGDFGVILNLIYHKCVRCPKQFFSPPPYYSWFWVYSKEYSWNHKMHLE